ncbi:unnamed protein product [Rhizopus stolonifer]
MDIDPKYKDVVCPVLLQLKRDNTVSIKEVISELEDFIITDYSPEKTLIGFKGTWLNRIGGCAKLLKLKLDKKYFSFKRIEQRISNTLDEAANSTSTSTTSTTASTSSKKSELKVPFSDELKQTFVSNFHKLDIDHFWYLNSSEPSPISVEEKLFNYGLKCQYLHPIHSFVVDLGDLTLQEIFTEKELLEIQGFGNSLLVHPLDEAISPGLSKLGELNDIFEVHNYFRKLDYHPLLEHLVAWMAMSITSTSFNFLGNEPLNTSLESDNLYRSWGFVNTICFYSKIETISKEKSSMANSKATNSKRKLSSIEEVSRKATGRKMDSIYVGAETELGVLEIGSRKNDDTKDLKDGYLKLPIVMKDMLKIIVDKYPAIKEKVNIVGYSIQDNRISYMNMDSPKGYITRIRRLKQLPYPTSSQDYTARMPALLTVAYNGFKTMNDTLSSIQSCKSQILPVIHSDDTFFLPPTLKSSKTTTSKVSESNFSL